MTSLFAPSKSDAYAAVHGQHHTRDKARGRQAKAGRNQAHVFRPAETVHRRTARNFLGAFRVAGQRFNPNFEVEFLR
jgi:hypothetical protein